MKPLSDLNPFTLFWLQFNMLVWLLGLSQFYMKVTTAIFGLLVRQSKQFESDDLGFGKLWWQFFLFTDILCTKLFIG